MNKIIYKQDYFIYCLVWLLLRMLRPLRFDKCYSCAYVFDKVEKTIRISFYDDDTIAALIL